MKFLWTMNTVFACLMLAACSGPPPEPVDAKITDPLEDGDAMDVTEVVISGDGQALVVAVTVAEPPVGESMIWETGILKVFIDVDNDPESGEAGYGWEEGGFEYEGLVWVCAEGGQFCPTDGEARDDIGLATLSLGDLENLDRETEHFTAGEVPGTKIEARVPYSALGLRPGQTIRVWAIEALDGLRQPEDRAGEALVTLG